MAKKKVYAVKKGHRPGIYYSWPETQSQVKGFAGARYRGFATEAEARSWLDGTEEKKPAGAARSRSAEETRVQPEPGEVIVYTDGGALGNPGPGGYGVVIIRTDALREYNGGFLRTTNNRMELTACIVALRQLGDCKESITLYSDSSYVVNGITKGWARGWRRRGWLKSNGDPAVNRDLWQELLELTEKLDVRFCWVRGHAGNPQNERCDTLVQQAARGQDLQPDRGYRPG